MKRYTILFLTVLMSFTMFACGKKEDKASIRNRGDRSSNYGQGSQISLGGNGSQSIGTHSKWGEVTQHQVNFQNAVYGLVAATTNPYNALGTVSGQAGDSTGVRIMGDVTSQNNGSVSSGALQVLIWDSKVNSGSDPIVFNMSLQSGSVNNSGATLTFGDEYGTITMQGNFDNSNNFSGVMTFQNNSHYDNTQQPVSDQLGWFVVPACGFFRGC